MRYYSELIQSLAFHAPYVCSSTFLKGLPIMVLYLGGKHHLIVPVMECSPYISRKDQAIATAVLETCCIWNDILIETRYCPTTHPKSWVVTLRKEECKVDASDRDKFIAFIKAFNSISVNLELKADDTNPEFKENLSIPVG